MRVIKTPLLYLKNLLRHHISRLKAVVKAHKLINFNISELRFYRLTY